MRSHFLCALLMSLAVPQSSRAAATFDLSEMPKSPTLKACRKWAASQKDEHTVRSWGQTRSGKTSRDVAVLRLTLSCLGDETPEIVMFGSNASFDGAYCSNDQHKDEEICKRKRGAAPRSGETR